MIHDKTPRTIETVKLIMDIENLTLLNHYQLDFVLKNNNQ
jgi:hypothetical protein